MRIYKTSWNNIARMKFEGQLVYSRITIIAGSIMNSMCWSNSAGGRGWGLLTSMDIGYRVSGQHPIYYYREYISQCIKIENRVGKVSWFE